jgi:hypothetical protein
MHVEFGSGLWPRNSFSENIFEQIFTDSLSRAHTTYFSMAIYVPYYINNLIDHKNAYLKRVSVQ